MRILWSPSSLRAALAMISTRFLAALLMFQTCDGYFPAVRSRRPRAVACGTPSTLSALVCSGKEVGIPELRWCVCVLFGGSHRAHVGSAVGGIERSSQAMLKLMVL